MLSVPLRTKKEKENKKTPVSETYVSVFNSLFTSQAQALHLNCVGATGTTATFLKAISDGREMGSGWPVQSCLPSDHFCGTPGPSSQPLLSRHFHAHPATTAEGEKRPSPPYCILYPFKKATSVLALACFLAQPKLYQQYSRMWSRCLNEDEEISPVHLVPARLNVAASAA